MKKNPFSAFVLPLAFILAITFTTSSQADMGGKKFTQAPCTTKGNAKAQAAILKSAQKQKYCVKLTEQLILVVGSFTWDEAKNDAISQGGRLTGIRSQAEQDILDSALPSVNYSDVWLGGIYRASNGHWVWDDSNVIFSTGNWDTGNFSLISKVYSRWDAYEPNNPGTENCVSAVGWHIYYNATDDAMWNNLPCDWTLPGYLMRLP